MSFSTKYSDPLNRRSGSWRAPGRALVLGFLIVLLAATATAQSSKQSPLGPPTGHVNDYANVIDPQTKSRLETILTNLKDRQAIEIAVVTVPTTNGEDIFEYSLAVARDWGIGAKDAEKAGLLLLVAINDRKYFTQVSRHLEGDLTDGLVGQIQREKLVPQFKQGRYSQGIYETIEAYIATLAEKRGFSIEGIDKSRAYRNDTQRTQSRRRSSGSGGGGPLAFCCVIIVVILLIVVFSNAARRGGGGGCLNMLLLGTLFNTMGRGGSDSGWGGGGFGGGGGGGGGFGGFGGGGDFGGGGSGGSW